MKIPPQQHTRRLTELVGMWDRKNKHTHLLYTIGRILESIKGVCGELKRWNGDYNEIAVLDWKTGSSRAQKVRSGGSPAGVLGIADSRS